jgi:hypothetical protein
MCHEAHEDLFEIDPKGAVGSRDVEFRSVSFYVDEIDAS